MVNRQMKGQAAAEARIPCEVYSRVVGYLRPVSSWHNAKKREFEDRETFDRATGDDDADTGRG